MKRDAVVLDYRFVDGREGIEVDRLNADQLEKRCMALWGQNSLDPNPMHTTKETLTYTPQKSQATQAITKLGAAHLSRVSESAHAAKLAHDDAPSTGRLHDAQGLMLKGAVRL
jgi:hypothetical protein